MTRTAILRYSNVEGPAIALHETLIDDRDFIYWAWWKKETEPFYAEPLRLVADAASGGTPVRVGLLSRKDGEYYVGECVGVEFRDDGVPFECPTDSVCPEYYRDRAFPAWFKFRRFEELDEARFRREFGAAPNLDPTLYRIVSTDSDFDIYPRPTWTMEKIEAPGPRILHLSDLHFGAYHAFPETDRDPGPGQLSLRTTLRNYLSRLGGAPIGVVVVSGDLISLGDANAYPAAKDLIEGVLEVLELTTDHVVIVPGNHDIWLEGVGEHPTRDYSHEKPYRNFLESFYKREFQDLEWIQRFDAHGWDLTFFTLNSARLRTLETKEYGYVGLHRYREMLRFIIDTLGGRPKLADHRLVAAVVHHHVLPVPLVSLAEDKRPVSLSLDAGQLLEEFQQLGVNLTIHGHQHVPFLSKATRLPSQALSWGGEEVLVLGGGSAGSTQLLQEAPFNTFAIYEPSDAGLRVITQKYTPMTPISELHDLQVPLL